MNKLLFIFATFISLVAYNTCIYADGGVKIYKNGSFTTIYANEIDSLVFFYDANDENGTINANTIIGIWKLIHEDGYEDGRSYSEDRTSSNEYYHLYEDGTCVRIRKDRDTGDWERNVSTYALDIENKKIQLYYSEWDDLLLLTETTMKIKNTWEYNGEEEWQIQTFQKVDDSVLDGIE